MGFELYPFQQEDVDKLEEQTGRLLNLEMGTGKTYEAWELDFRNVQNDHGNTLWIAPMQTFQGSIDKMHEMGFDTPYVILNPKDRSGSWQRFKRLKGGVFFAHWESLRLLPELNDEVGMWEHVVADEVHRAQNRKSQTTVALKKIRGLIRTGMSGTPVTTAGDKYWSVLNWAQPDKWRSYWFFAKRYVIVELDERGYRHMKGPNPLTQPELDAKVRPYIVRHLKKEECCPHHPQGVMPWLPDKYYDRIWVDLTPKQRKAYNDMKQDMLAWVGAHEDKPLAAPVVIAQMIRLQQFAMASADIRWRTVHRRAGYDEDVAEVFLDDPSSKADALMEVLTDNSTESIVHFTQFNKFIHLMARRLDKAKIPYVMYTGENRGTREEDKRRFLDGSARVFLGNIAAGGVGVDGLQDVASTMVFTDRLWSPALNNQAEDRLWRDGQLNAVNIIDIMARQTVDLGRYQRIEQTWTWIKALLGDKIDQKTGLWVPKS